MAKTKAQEAAMEYAKQYLDTIFEIEDYMGRSVEKKIDQIVDIKLRHILGKDDAITNEDKANNI